MSVLTPRVRFRPGQLRQEALDTFRDSVNKPGMIFSTDHWLSPRLARLSQMLHDPITDEEAAALEDILHGRRWMRDLLAWLEHEQPVSWQGYFIRAEFQEEESKRQHAEELRKLDEEWAISEKESSPDTEEAIAEAKAFHLKDASACRTCGTPPDYLEWLSFCSPPSTWDRLFGRAGWKTRCRFCAREVDSFVEMMN